MIHFPELSDIKKLTDTKLKEIIETINKSVGSELTKLCKYYNIKGCSKKSVSDLKTIITNFIVKESKGIYSLTRDDLLLKTRKDLTLIMDKFNLKHNQRNQKNDLIDKILKFIKN